MRHQIKGWAFTGAENEAKESAENQARYAEIAHHRGVIANVSPRYGMTDYHGNVPEGLDAKDIAILCDHGNVCFGATVDMSGATFKCTIFFD